MADLSTNIPELLSPLTDQDIKAVAKSLKVEFHPRISRANLIERVSKQQGHLVEHSISNLAQNLGECKPVETPFISQEAIEKAIASQLKKQGYRAEFDLDEKTWQFSYAGAIDSGTMCQPLKRIVQSAIAVGNGAFRLPTERDANSGQLGGGAFHMG